MSNDWCHEETEDPLHADRHNFYKVEKWSRDGGGISFAFMSGSGPTTPTKPVELLVGGTWRRPMSAAKL
jgi:hypothetical protein